MSYYQYQDAPIPESSDFSPYSVSGPSEADGKSDDDFQLAYPSIPMPDLLHFDSPFQSPDSSASSEAFDSPGSTRDFSSYPSVVYIEPEFDAAQIYQSSDPLDCDVYPSSEKRSDFLSPSRISSFSELSGVFGSSPVRGQPSRIFGSPSSESDKENIPPRAVGQFDDAPEDDDDEGMEFVISYPPRLWRRDTTLLPISSVRPPILYAPTPIHSLIPSITSFESFLDSDPSTSPSLLGENSSSDFKNRSHDMKRPASVTLVPYDPLSANNHTRPRKYVQSSMRDYALDTSPERSNPLYILADVACLANH